MAFVFVDHDAKCFIPVDVCDIIYLCLVDPWKDRTKTGFPYVEARVVRIDQLCNTDVVNNCCSTTTTCEEFCRYNLEINNDQFLQDPATSKPYAIAKDDIAEMIPYHCLVSKLIDYFNVLPDHVLDYENVTLTQNPTTNEATFTFPVKDRVNDVAIGTATLVLPGGTLSENLGASTITYTSFTGDTFTVNVGDLFESQIDGVTIVRDPGTGIYSCVSGDITVNINNNDTTQGANAYYTGSVTKTGTNEITVERYPEHYSIAESIRFASQNYLTQVEVATLQNGDSNIQTPAFVSTVVNNPSTNRAMRVKITLTGSFAADATPATGFAVFGHTLWVDGVKIVDRNGRSNAGFNISWGDGVGYLQDYALPTIEYAHTIPAGGSVTIGADFGDSDTFATIGTVNVISLESRQISVVGGTI